MLALMLAGRNTTRDKMTTRLDPGRAEQAGRDDERPEVRSATDRVGQAYGKNPRDPVNGVNYANPAHAG